MIVAIIFVEALPRGGPVSDDDFACCTPLTGTAMSTEQAEQVAPLLKALADPVRLRLVSLIASSAGGEACVCDLNEAFDQTQATISHHLKVLHSAGLLDREKRGVWVYYAVRPEALSAVATLFTAPALAGTGA
jgi:ArsR family transcriptional regulator